MKYYIEAFDNAGSEILGNLDGQCRLIACNYKRTNIYKDLVNADKSRSVKYSKVSYWVVVSEFGYRIETIANNMNVRNASYARYDNR